MQAASCMLLNSEQIINSSLMLLIDTDYFDHIKINSVRFPINQVRGVDNGHIVLLANQFTLESLQKSRLTVMRHHQ